MEYQLITEGMTCQGCVNHVTQVLKKVDSEALVKIDLLKQSIDISTQKPKELFITALQDAEYPVLNS